MTESTDSPGVWRRVADRADRIGTRLALAFFARVPRQTVQVMDEEWDTLLLLDACRYDAFERVNELPGTLDRRRSAGSDTGEFFEANVGGRQCHDTVYVTGTPVPREETWCDVAVDDVFYDTVDVWTDHWDDQLNTVPPEAVADAVRTAHETYPDKRILGHFVQPHQPFIGEIGREIDQGGMRAYDVVTGRDDYSGQKVWERLADGELSRDRVWEAYLENLALVLSTVEELVAELTGKIVVTSDHGNLFGEFAWPIPIRKYGHPRGIHTTNLVAVPWLELPFDRRRETTTDTPEEADEITAETTRRLEQLGYR